VVVVVVVVVNDFEFFDCEIVFVHPGGFWVFHSSLTGTPSAPFAACSASSVFDILETSSRRWKKFASIIVSFLPFSSL
jgi:hypothetical protein